MKINKRFAGVLRAGLQAGLRAVAAVGCAAVLAAVPAGAEGLGGGVKFGKNRLEAKAAAERKAEREAKRAEQKAARAAKKGAGAGDGGGDGGLSGRPGKTGARGGVSDGDGGLSGRPGETGARGGVSDYAAGGVMQNGAIIDLNATNDKDFITSTAPEQSSTLSEFAAPSAPTAPATATATAADSAANSPLLAAYQAALVHDKQLLAASYEREIAAARSRQTLANLLPSVSLTASKNIDRYERFGREMDESYAAYGVIVRQQVFRPGMWMAARAEGKRKAAATQGFANARAQLALRTSEAFFAYQFAAQMSALAASVHEANTARREQISKSFADGLVSKMDFLEAKIRADKSFLDMSKARRDEQIARTALENITGTAAPAPETLKLSGFDIKFFERLDLAAFADVSANYELQQMELAAEAARADFLSARSEMLPSVDFQASWMNNLYDEAEMFGDKKNQLNVRVSLNWPIFTSGFMSARKEEARYAHLMAKSRTERVKDELELQLSRTVSEYAAALEQSKIAASSLEHAKLYELAMERGHKMGLKDLTELLDARSRAYEARAEAIKSASALVASYLRLMTLAGRMDEAAMRELAGAI